ncbi:MAG: L,D-transpeptidase [Candidatus Margulisiibacteriota bacterium]
MRKPISTVLLLLALVTGALAQDGFESLRLINAANWGKLFNEMLGAIAPSKGDLHFAPVDAYLLYRILPVGLPLTVKPYHLAGADPSFRPEAIPFLADITLAETDIEKHQKRLGQNASAAVYPSLGRLFLLADGAPYAQVRVAAGPVEDFLLPNDPFLNKQTPAGWYKLSARTNHYLSGAFYEESVVPFGAWLQPVNGTWSYQEGGAWFRLPGRIAADLAAAPDRRVGRYFDVQTDSDGRITAARWGDNRFGRYALFWSVDGRVGSPFSGYAPGGAVFEQVMLTKDLVELLTAPGPDDFDAAVSRNRDLANYQASGSVKPALTPAEAKAVGEFTEDRLPREKGARRAALGRYWQVQTDQLALARRAGWYERIRREWPFFRQLREQLRADFTRMGVYALENRQNVLEEWLTDRLEYRTVTPPGEAKYVQELNFSTFFRPVEKPSVFTERERAVMKTVIRRAASGEAGGLALRSVMALNEYNFGLILNDILGDLYKSHGCIHVSPRNSYFLYEILPLGAEMVVHPYTDRLSAEAIAAVPPLANLVNYAEDLEKLKAAFADRKAVRIDVYPSSGFWLVSLDGKPFARLAVKGGAQKVMQMVMSRDAKGRPVFEAALAYPTSPGRFRILKRTTNYVSNLYRDTTIIPMGGEIVSRGDHWSFQDSTGQWRDLPASVADDLNKPSEARQYTFYDPAVNASGEVASVKWGSHPFGKYALITTKDGRTAWPELIHSSGDLIMEERQLINDLIYVLAAPHDALDDCLDNSPNFGLYKDCYDFVSGVNSGEVLGDRERAAYKLHYGLPRTASEEATLPPDTVAAYRSNRGGLKMKLDQRKIDGLVYDNYMYVVTVEKYAHHYATLRRYWQELSGLRLAMLRDFNDFVVKDPVIFHSFMRELMLARTRLERLSQENAIRQLAKLLE